MRLGRLQSYGDLNSVTGTGCDAEAEQVEGGIAQALCAEADRLDCSVTHRAGNDVIAAQGESVRYRL
jgi:hypothetical protein